MLAYKKALTQDELKGLLIKAAENPDDADIFFSSFDYLDELNAGNAARARSQALELLNTCRRLDHDAYMKIARGTPYYWLGYASYLLEDYESAVFFFDASASEDIRFGGNPQRDARPSFHFMLLEGAKPNQAAQPLVKAAQDRVEEVIRYYNGLADNHCSLTPLTIEGLREHFLCPALDPSHGSWRSLATSFISFFLEWDYRNSLLDVLLELGTIEPFFMHLFKGCVLFESLLKENPTIKIPSSAETLSQVLPCVTQHMGLSPVPSIRESNFSNVLNLLTAELQTPPLSLSKAIELTGKTRNTLGHNLGWKVQINKFQYHHLFRIVAASCLHVIACLYR